MIESYSASKLKTYSFCPRRYHYVYDLKLIQRKSVALTIGTKYHSSVEKLSHGINVEVPTKDTILKGLVDKYKLYPLKGTVVDTEKKFQFTLNDILIKGIFDRIDIDKTVEYKTTSKDYKEEDVDNFQTDIYILARYLLTGELLPLVYHVNNKKKIKTKKYKPQVIVVEKSIDQLDEIKRNIVKSITDIRNKKFEPNPGDHCFYCPFGPNKYIGTGNCNAYRKYKKK